MEGCNAVVCVIDDHDDARMMMATVLRLEGYTVVTASNGSEGLDCIRRWNPCLVVLDLMMPVMDGFQFRDRQRQDPAVAHIPVLVVSAMPDAMAAASRLAAVGVLPKPIEIKRLLEAVKKYCGAPSAEDATTGRADAESSRRQDAAAPPSPASSSTR